MQDARFTNRMDRKQAVRLWTDCRRNTEIDLPSIVDSDVLRSMVIASLTDKYGLFYGPCMPAATLLCLLKAKETLHEALHYWQTAREHSLDAKRTAIDSIYESIHIAEWHMGDTCEVPSVAACEYVSPIDANKGELDDENKNGDKCNKEKKKHTRGDITQRDAAELCAVSIRLIQKWENNKNTPDGFPGRSNAFAFRAWAESYKSGKRLKQAAVAMNRATSVDPKIIEARCSVSGFTEDADDQDERTLDDLIEEQGRDQAETGRRIKQV